MTRAERSIIAAVGLCACLGMLLSQGNVLQARTLAGKTQVSDRATLVDPIHCITSHDVGRLVLAVNNNGTFGDGFSSAGNRDCFTGEEVFSCEFPKGSGTTYLWGGAFWIGAVVGRDTLVSTGHDGWQALAEFNPDIPPLGRIIYRSTIDPAKPEYEGAVSEQDFLAVYFDTCVNCPGLGIDYLDSRGHQPIHVEVTQRSFAWSYEYAEDFVLFDYAIRNIGSERIREAYLGIYVDADVRDRALSWTTGAEDDICGFKRSMPAAYLPPACPPDSDIVNVAWLTDNNGDLDQDTFRHVPHVMGARIVRTPAESLTVSFNWWLSNGAAERDFGPQTRAEFRDFQTGGLGTPEGDRNKYHVLSNGEFDYDQITVASITPLDPVWMTPPANEVTTWATGLDVRFLLSFGPFEIEPGQTLPVSFALVAGENLHTYPSNLDFLPDNWRAFYSRLDFSDLGRNATWADWIYDNPGVDTDSDGYAGEFTLCNLGTDSSLRIDTIFDADTVVSIDTSWVYARVDTVWRKGDGVPDFKGASPPPAPVIRTEPSVGTIRVVFNGLRSENTRDVFTGEHDWEGYRVYFSRDSRRDSYVMLASYDREDYNKYVWDNTVSAFVLLESPFLLDTLRSLYGGGNPDWDPLACTRTHPYVLDGYPDSVFYFTAQDFNRSVLANDPGATTPIRKLYPDAPRPAVLSADSIPEELRDVYLTEDGLFKFYEYEYVIQNLLPTVPYFVNVTAFDYGSPRSGLPSLETSPTTLPIQTYALESIDGINSGHLDVFVYPNPYRLDAGYRERGFEGRDRSDRPADRTRELHFANLPARCTIRIHSLDGDLIREIDHDIPESDPLANHDTWDLITRNTQKVVSGLYYWTVEDKDTGHTQIGKLCIIM
ncbi:MAG: hypothetical protein KKA42_12650 [candidate division Zixibacteria bacterium]|nr:hypothetical protein [candidate division Zixibacteria bacterium]